LIHADIQAGLGLYFETLTNTWRAKECLNNTYGMTNNTFGLTPNPCRDCEWLPQSCVCMFRTQGCVTAQLLLACEALTQSLNCYRCNSE
jgi:hypothetical protein